MHIKHEFALLLILLAAIGCSTQPEAQQEKPPGFGSLATYPMPPAGGGGPEMEYCFYYSKRMWELTNLVKEQQITPQKAQETTKASLGSLAVEEDMADLEKFGLENVTPEQLAGERFIRCAKALGLPVEARHLPISQSCFGLLRFHRYVYGLKARGQSALQVRDSLVAANPSASRSIGSTVDEIYAASSDDQFNALNRKIFLSCIAAGGSSSATQR